MEKSPKNQIAQFTHNETKKLWLYIGIMTVVVLGVMCFLIYETTNNKSHLNDGKLIVPSALPSGPTPTAAHNQVVDLHNNNYELRKITGSSVNIKNNFIEFAPKSTVIQRNTMNNKSMVTAAGYIKQLKTSGHMNIVDNGPYIDISFDEAKFNKVMFEVPRVLLDYMVGDLFTKGSTDLDCTYKIEFSKKITSVNIQILKNGVYKTPDTKDNTDPTVTKVIENNELTVTYKRPDAAFYPCVFIITGITDVHSTTHATNYRFVLSKD